MSKRDMIINPITGEIDLDLHKIVKGFSTGGQSLKDSLTIDAPRRTPNHPSSSHVVKTRVDGEDKMIRFGEQGASTAGKPKEGESDKMKAKRKSFKDRHAKNIAKGKSSAAYWANKEKWAEGGGVEKKKVYQIPPSYLDIAGDVVFDTVSGLVGPIAASAVSLGEQAFTDNTIQEMIDNNETYNAALNYTPRTDEGQATSDYAMGKLSEGVTYLADKYNENKDSLGPIPGMIDYGIEKYSQLEPETRFATGNALTVGEVIPVAKVAGLAKRGAVQGAQSVKQGVEGALNKRAINKAASQVPDDSAYDLLRQKYLDQGMIVQSVREPGDQILDASPVDDALARLRSPVFSNVVGTEGAEALDNWMNTKLRKFILNEMGSKNDSVKLAADEGFTLGPGDYESIADAAISDNTLTAGEYLNRYNMVMNDDFVNEITGELMRDQPLGMSKKLVNLVEDNPWLSKVPPETVIRDIDGNALVDDLNFRHMVDEIQNAMDPNTSLPKQLQISAKDLKKISMRQMVEKVSKINDWRMKEADRVSKKELLDNIADTNTVIDLPDFDLSFVDKKGGGWVEMPDAASDSGGKVCTTIGKAGGWCTQGETMAKSYGSGDSRLIALLDGEGRPHIQLNLKIRDDGTLVLGEVKPIGNTFFSNKVSNYMSKDPEYRTKLGSALKTFLNQNQGGFSQNAMSGSYDILDFGLFDMKDMDHVQAKLKDIFSEEYDNGMGAMINSNFQSMLTGSKIDGIELPRFLTRGEFLELMDPYTPNTAGGSGYAKGGTVYNPNLIKKNAVQLLMEADNG